MKHKLHRALVLGPGGLIALWVLAGCALLWQESFQHRPNLPIPEALVTPSLTQVLAAAQSRYLQPGSWRLRLPRNSGEAVQAIYFADDLLAEAAEPQILWLDPQTAKILAETQAKTPFWQKLYRFHACLLLEDKGNWAALSCGLVLGGIMLSGMLLWRCCTRLSGVRALHCWLGIGILPLLSISLISGVFLSLPAGWLSGSEPQTDSIAVTLSRAPTVDEIAFLAKKLFPDHSLRELLLPQTEDEPWELALYRPGTLDVEPAWVRVWIDAKHNRVRIREPSTAWREHLRQWVYVLHTGQVAGKTGQLALSLGGVGFLLQAALGVVLWLRRRRRLAARSPVADRKQQIA